MARLAHPTTVDTGDLRALAGALNETRTAAATRIYDLDRKIPMQETAIAKMARELRDQRSRLTDMHTGLRRAKDRKAAAERLLAQLGGKQ